MGCHVLGMVCRPGAESQAESKDVPVCAHCSLWPDFQGRQASFHRGRSSVGLHKFVPHEPEARGRFGDLCAVLRAISAATAGHCAVPSGLQTHKDPHSPNGNGLCELVQLLCRPRTSFTPAQPSPSQVEVKIVKSQGCFNALSHCTVTTTPGLLNASEFSLHSGVK